ncbi:hypothetical protein AAEO56_11090 [Flavobacterium sp. DGU11]|uniref:Uncharacterized protein n=1 Tax=Flavobacterium arundinis TaxID=3139143 RepID=A0ABU9HYJ9_9FLAO
MDEIKIEDIDNYAINELSQYLFGTGAPTRAIAQKKIADITTSDLLYLLRRRCYTDIAALLAIREMEVNGFYGHSFKYDERTVTQQDILKELLLLPDSFWNTNQRSFHKLKPFAETNSIHANLPHKVVAQFLEFSPEPIVWSKKDIGQMVYLEAMGALSLFLTAMDMLRQLKRAVDEGIKATLDWEGNTFDINNVADIREHILPLITEDPDYLEDYEEVLDKEVKICF